MESLYIWSLTIPKILGNVCTRVFLFPNFCAKLISAWNFILLVMMKIDMQRVILLHPDTVNLMMTAPCANIECSRFRSMMMYNHRHVPSVL
jgi:hypothetical protein